MTPKQTVRTLTLVAWTLLALAHGKGGLFKKGQKCQVLKPVMEVDWKKMEGVEWMEGLTFPDVWKKCPVLRFYPHNETLFLQTKDGPYSPIKSSDRLKLLFNGTRQYWYKTRSGSWFMLLLRKPLKAIPETVMARVKSSMAKAGRTKKYWWKRTGCMLPEDVQKLVIVDGLVP
ncbi:uncharacterized protein LOC119444055 isoform X2 [Dermacentor silvarum]|uniref:uncharacterized protein LOC119444055 isoform X2 n=1 Tax=Dermacentor silvarum TaxID=543639 RepID=UPI002100B6A3|nr:uncharacterized protein LOC119444055 isoform X2 [Dermacentor silvarum]